MNIKPTKSAVIGLKEFRHNMEEYIERVRKGESLTIVRRSKPIFRLSPVHEGESEWETVIDFTEINPHGVSGREILKRLQKRDGQN